MSVDSSQGFVSLSGQVGVDPETSPLSAIVVPVLIGLAILLWRRRHRIEPERSITEPSGLSPLDATASAESTA